MPTPCLLWGVSLIGPVGYVKVKVRDSGCKHTLFRPFSIVGPLQFSITNDWTLLRDITWRTTHTQNPSHFRLCRAPGAKAANTIFKVFSMTRLGIKPQPVSSWRHRYWSKGLAFNFGNGQIGRRAASAIFLRSCVAKALSCGYEPRQSLLHWVYEDLVLVFVIVQYNC